MNNSLNNSDVDVDINSIFNRKSSPNSPFLVVSPFFSGQFNLNRPRTPQQDVSKMHGRMFAVPDFGYYNDTKRLLEQPKVEWPNLPSFNNWRVPVIDPRDIPNTISTDLNSNGLKFIQTQSQFKDKAQENLNSVETMISTKISTNSMIMENPMAKQGGDNFHLKDSVENKDEQRYNFTSFYLKKFNMFSNSLASLPTVDDSVLEPPKAALNGKKIKKPALKPLARVGKTKGPEKKSKRKITCNCKNSGCIKMYCECFREVGYCGSLCKCKDCKNVETNAERKFSLTNLHKKQADEFAFKLSRDEAAKQLANGTRNCKCKKSQCQKKYCECYNDGAFCNAECCCMDCLNFDTK